MRLLLLLLLASAVAVCAATSEAAAAVPRDPVPVTSTSKNSDAEKQKKVAERCRPKSVKRMGTSRTSYAAVVRKRAIAYRSPGKSELERFGPLNVNGVATVFAVLAKQVDRHCGVSWYRVQLPLKPNGITGWVRPYAVNLVPVTTRIHVDLSARLVTLFVRGKKALTARAAIGTRATPTPTGRYYVNQRLIPSNSNGPFGPGALGISAFSEVLTGWVQGGPIAIHGTNRPHLLGQAVSNGCIRIHNDKLVRLFRRAGAGTPVTVRA
ncbi:MAG: L,D-transpeptidase [Gaiellaceae bacterium]